ncbi:MAG: recombinase family protein [Bifidobacteriaceae bacterium]|nr:recombinase family protein [Bifidobacteriaceae bacterium]
MSGRVRLRPKGAGKTQNTRAVSAESQLTAVSYLRVSTKDQATKGGEAEGFSIPAQRRACDAKIASLGAVKVAEFVDAGESAKTANRRDLKAMMEFVAEHRPTYVVVHKIDRLARNRYDDATLTMQLQLCGTTLISVSENIDESPSGTLMHAVMAGIAEFYSRNLAVETQKGTMQKVAGGGTPFKAPLGYLNTRQIVDMREVRTITVDPERAPHIQWLFEQYATGEWSLPKLAAAVTARGLTTRATPSRPEGAVSDKLVQAILRNRYYIGYVTYKGVEYEGNHQPLVSSVLFQQAQDVMAGNGRAQERPRKHRHYLSGTVKCARCGSRLVYNVITGNGGRYDYFTCTGRLSKRTDCDLPYLEAIAVEQAVVAAWDNEQLEPETLERLKEALNDHVTAIASRNAREIHVLDQRIGQVKAERVKWAENVMDGAVPRDIARDKQAALDTQLVSLEQQRSEVAQTVSSQTGAVGRAVEVLGSLGNTYRDGPPALRRACNQAWFDGILIDDDESQPTAAAVCRTDSVETLMQAASLAAGSTIEMSRQQGRCDIWETEILDNSQSRTCGIRDAAKVRRNDITSVQNAKTASSVSFIASACSRAADGSNKGSLVPPTGFEPVLPP